MSYFNGASKYIRQVIVGKTIKSIKDKDGKNTMRFTDGTALVFYPHIEGRTKPCGCRVQEAVIIANGHHPNGDVISTIEAAKLSKQKKGAGK